MSMRQIEARIAVLQRRFADSLAVVRARRVAEEFCDKWAAAKDKKKSLPSITDAVPMLRQAGVRNTTLIDLNQYFGSCRNDDRCPDVAGFLHTALAKPPLRRPPPRRAPLGCPRQRPPRVPPRAPLLRRLPHPVLKGL